MNTYYFIPIMLISISCLTQPCFAFETHKGLDEALRRNVIRLLDRPDLSQLQGERFSTEIEFVVTRQNKIVVLAVYTESAFLDAYVKEKLNYQEIRLKGVPRLTPFRIEVNFLQPEGTMQRIETKPRVTDPVISEAQTGRKVTPRIPAY